MRPTVRPLRRRRRRPCRHRRRRFCRCARVTSSRALYRALQRSKKHANAHNAVTRVCSGAAEQLPWIHRFTYGMAAGHAELAREVFNVRACACTVSARIVVNGDKQALAHTWMRSDGR